MPPAIEKAFRNAPLGEYSFGKRILIPLIAGLSYFVINIIGKTLRYEIEGWENFEVIEGSGRRPIYCFWHNRILAGTYFFRDRGIVVMTSQSDDGEYIARFINKFGYGTVRGSSTRGGMKALVELVRLVKSGKAAAFTVDGPRGPKYEAKLGPVLLAKKTGNPLMPFIFECRSYWEAGSWDHLQIPKPFTRVKLFIGEPIYVDHACLDEALEVKRDQLQLSLDSLVQRGHAWRGGN